MSIALYRKYRPENFENLVGQEVVQTTLKNAILNKKLAHAYVLSGPRGTGKTSTARLIAKAMNCSDLKDGFSPCDKCQFCEDIAKGSLLDVVEIDAASHNGVDDVRDLVDKINFAPTRSKYKFYIVDEAHMMSKGAFNALLKTLEEPPEYVYFILATTEIHKVPETILSRCQRFDFQRISLEVMQARLEFVADSEGFEYEKDAIEMIARFVNGGMRDALVALEKLAISGKITTDLVRTNLGISDFRECRTILEFLLAKDSASALDFVTDLYEKGVDLRQFMKDFLALVREDLLKSVKSKGGQTASLLKIIDETLEARTIFEKTDIVQLAWELMIVNCCFGEIVHAGLQESVAPAVTKNTAEKIVYTPKVETPIINKKVSETVVEVKKTVAVAPQNVNGLNVSDVQRGISDIIEKITAPSLRMSLKTLQVLAIDGGTLILGVNSSFHLEKVNAGLADLKYALKEVKGWDFEITMKMVEANIDFNPAPEPERKFAGIKPLEPAVEKTQPTTGFEAPKDVDLALDMFGGEIVD